MNSKVCVKVAASTANLGPGFDSLGMALDLYTWIEMSFAGKTEFHLYGEQVQGVPQDKTNLIYEVAQQVFAKAGMPERDLEVSMYSDIPLARGLGSSASAIVGALFAANALIDDRFSDQELFDMAATIENHPDNVGASIFGGIITAMWNGTNASHVRIEPNERLEALVVIPEFELSTKHARSVLPDQVPLRDAVFNLSHSSVLVAALMSGRFELIREAMQDKLHQPYRASLVPGMADILANATDHGALGVALSGAGPTMLALVDSSGTQKDELEAFFVETLKSFGIPAATLWLKPARHGVERLTPDDKHCTFIDRLKGEQRA